MKLSFLSLSLGILTMTAHAQDIKASPATTAFVSPAAKTTWKFTFGAKAAPDVVLVAPTTSYTPELGYGFEPGSALTTREEFFTSNKPFLFSAAVPEGNYRVTLTLGDKAGESNTTVKAETRRLMLENISTTKGQSTTYSFTVNVRTPLIATGGAVRINDREKGPPLKLHWDEKLTLEFNGSRPYISSLEIAREENAPMIFLAGDSTVTDQSNEPYAAWGQMLPRFFKPGVAVANYAESGLALTSFRSQRRLEKVLSLAENGDYVFIQFGHNDQKDKREGAGPFTTYKSDLKDYVAKVREKGASVVVVTPMERRRWQDGKPQPTLADYAEAVRQVATEEKVPLIDLNAMSLQFYSALGEDKSKRAFAYATTHEIPGLREDIKDNTHFSNYGAYQLAQCIVKGIREHVPSLTFWLANDLPPFDPTSLDPLEKFAVPASPYKAGEKPAGS